MGIGFVVLRFVLLSLGAAVLLSLHGALSDPSLLDDEAQMRLLSQSGGFVAARLGINAVAMFLPMWIVLKRRGVWTRAQLWLLLPEKRWLGYGMLLTLGIVPLAYGISQWVNRSASKGAVNTQAETLQAGLQVSPVTAALVILFAAVLIPFIEELAFRGVLFPWLTEKWGVMVGVIGSAVLFAAIHPELGVAISAFAIGLILATLTWYAKSIWPAILVHILNNLYGVLTLLQSL